MPDASSHIQSLLDREARAWQAGDAEAIVDLCHPDMLWPLTGGPMNHDPATWSLAWGRFDRQRWTALWQGLFDGFTLEHNRWSTVKIELSAKGDAALAVVDIDALWRERDGDGVQHWKGLAAKGYSLCGGEWKLILQHGLLEYPPAGPA